MARSLRWLCSRCQAQPRRNVDRQSLDDAWWTGPIVAAGAATLPAGHALIEPYVYDVITRGRYDSDGNYRSTDTVHSYGSLTYMLYGVTDGFTAGVIPTFGFNDVEQRRGQLRASASAT